MIDIKFGSLFTIGLLHNYFADQLCDDFVITPTNSTAALLSGHNIVVRQLDDQFYAGIKTNGANSPFIVPEEGLQLTFMLQLTAPLFFNYTNLPLSWPSGNIYHFTNRNNNSSNSRNFLSLPTPYSNTTTYNIGDIALNATGTVFEAIRTIMGTPPPADGVLSASWLQVDVPAARNRYVSGADEVQWLSSLSSWNLTTPAASVVLNVWGYDLVARDYTQVVLSQTLNFPQPVSSFNLDLSSLTPGRYQLGINGTQQAIYVNDELAGTGTFAVIDIFQEASLPAGYQLLDGSGNLLSPVYSVFFLNRATIWKYTLNSNPISGITDNAGVYQFTVSSPVSSTAFSATPIPLNEKALNLQLTVGTQNYSPIECPSPARISSTVQNGDFYGCSEVFLNY